MIVLVVAQRREEGGASHQFPLDLKECLPIGDDATQGHQVAGVQHKVGFQRDDAIHHRLVDLMLRAGVAEGDEGKFGPIGTGGGAKGHILAQGHAAALDAVAVGSVWLKASESDGVACAHRRVGRA